jgi:hypothetical protein
MERLSEHDAAVVSGAIYDRMSHVQARYQAAWERYCTTPERAARVDAGETYCRLAAAWERLSLAYGRITRPMAYARMLEARNGGAS